MGALQSRCSSVLPVDLIILSDLRLKEGSQELYQSSCSSND